jgi:hypothetical protein
MGREQHLGNQLIPSRARCAHDSHANGHNDIPKPDGGTIMLGRRAERILLSASVALFGIVFVLPDPNKQHVSTCSFSQCYLSVREDRVRIRHARHPITFGAWLSPVQISWIARPSVVCCPCGGSRGLSPSSIQRNHTQAVSFPSHRNL